MPYSCQCQNMTFIPIAIFGQISSDPMVLLLIDTTYFHLIMTLWSSVAIKTCRKTDGHNFYPQENNKLKHPVLRARTCHPPHVIWYDKSPLWEPCYCQWLMAPIPYMGCWNLVTVIDVWSPHTLYGMQEPCNCQWLLWSPHTLYEMWEPCNCHWLMVLPYLIWNTGTL